MGIKLVLGAVVAAVIATGLAPAAQADGINREICLAVMALGVDPNNPNDHYTLNMLERYPDMTYNQAVDLVETAYRAVHFHQNPMCDGVTIPVYY